ncbi:LysR family transcriptional regulator [Roseomonas elaeocarpi]|uniref:LysR family transcriptional regulator n=1 Tax=Roseomonas elaeocarpi TaxID=907779 RepID=A0ABV6JRK6_9PROT
MDYRSKLPNLSHLAMLQRVVEAGSVSKASRIVRRSQPTMTLALRKLEAFAGAPLLERGHSGSQPTEAGWLLLARVDRLFGQLDDALLNPLVGGPIAQQERLAALRAKLSATAMRGLIAIAEQRGVPAAALATGLSKPTLYRMARDLERVLGRSVFDPSSDGMVPNKIGFELARRFNLALKEIGHALEEIASLQGDSVSRIHIGIRRTSATQPLSEAMEAFLNIHPKARIRIEDGAFEQMIQDLRYGRIDLIYGPLEQPHLAADVVQEALFHLPYSIVVRAGHPLTRKSRVTTKDLVSFDWIISRPGSPRRKACDALLAKSLSSPSYSIETSSTELMLTVAANSNRIALLTTREARQHIEAGLLTTLDHAEVDGRTDDGIITRRDWRPTPVQARFVELLRKPGSVGRSLPRRRRDA